MLLSEESKAMILWMIISIAILTVIIALCMRFYDYIARCLCFFRGRETVVPEQDALPNV